MLDSLGGAHGISGRRRGNADEFFIVSDSVHDSVNVKHGMRRQETPWDLHLVRDDCRSAADRDASRSGIERLTRS